MCHHYCRRAATCCTSSPCSYPHPSTTISIPSLVRSVGLLAVLSRDPIILHAAPIALNVVSPHHYLFRGPDFADCTITHRIRIPGRVMPLLPEKTRMFPHMQVCSSAVCELDHLAHVVVGIEP